MSLDISFWTVETIEYFTPDCLHMIFVKGNSPVALGRLWAYMPSRAMNEFLLWYTKILQNVTGSDFQYMPSDLLKLLFSLESISDYLPQPSTGIILSSQASEVEVESWQFSALVKSVPSVAAQLLWYSKRLPEDVLAHCDGNDIRTLKLVLDGKEMDWKSLFVKLEERYLLDERTELFSQIVKSISREVKNHFCASLLDPDEFLSMTWLYNNLSDSCRSALPFSSFTVAKLFSRPELVKDNFSWTRILGVYSLNDWALLSQSKRIGNLLGKECSFWKSIETGKWSELLRVLEPPIFASITSNCVLELKNTLRQNANLIPFLADDAFSQYEINQLPCSLQDLSPGQLAQLSSRIRGGEGDLKHILSRITLDELKALKFEQFKSLYESQRAFISNDIKMEALNWQLQASQSQVLAIAAKIKKNIASFKSLADGQVDLKAAQDRLCLIMKVYKNSLQEDADSGLITFISYIRQLNLQQTFVKIFGKSPLNLGIIGLLGTAKELKGYVREAIKQMGAEATKITVFCNRQFVFDRFAMIDTLKKTP